MNAIREALSHRLSSDSLDARLVQLACYLGAVAIVPTSVVALVRHPGSRADFVLALGMSCLLGLLFVMLGMLCRRGIELPDRLPLRSRRLEFASYAACLGLLVLGVRWLADLGLSPAQVTLGLLLTCSLSVAVLVLGMISTLVRSLQR